MDTLEILKLFSDCSRLRILHLLYQKDLCVCELVYLLGLTQSNVSKHLNNMIQLGAVENYKVNKYTFYKLHKNILSEFPFVVDIINSLTVPNTTSSELNKLFIRDLNKLNTYAESSLTHEDICGNPIINI